MMIKAIGAGLTAIGFTALAASTLLRDPAELDANIGAGILAMIGIPVGSIGVLTMIITTLVSMAHTRGQRRPAAHTGGRRAT